MFKNYYRRITELLPTMFKKKVKKVSKETSKKKQSELIDHLFGYLFMVLLLTAGISFLFGINFFIKYEAVREERKKTFDSFSYWRDIVKKHPNLTDGYYNAALYSLKLGDKITALEYLEKAIKLDPSFEQAIELEKEIAK